MAAVEFTKVPDVGVGGGQIAKQGPIRLQNVLLVVRLARWKSPGAERHDLRQDGPSAVFWATLQDRTGGLLLFGAAHEIYRAVLAGAAGLETVASWNRKEGPPTALIA